MEQVLILLTMLPASVLIVLVICGFLFLVLVILLLAFVPQLAERFIAVIDAFHRLSRHESAQRSHRIHGSGQSDDVDTRKQHE